jgi:adenylosuccinate lyase
MTRQNAYRLVQSLAMESWHSGKEFYQLVKESAQVRKILSDEEIDACFDLNRHLRHVDTIFARVGLA